MEKYIGDGYSIQFPADLQIETTDAFDKFFTLGNYFTIYISQTAKKSARELETLMNSEYIAIGDQEFLGMENNTPPFETYYFVINKGLECEITFLGCETRD